MMTHEEIASKEMRAIYLDDNRPTGKWIRYKKTYWDGQYDWSKCSECQIDAIGFETDFCPHCGAKMKKQSF